MSELKKLNLIILLELAALGSLRAGFAPVRGLCVHPGGSRRAGEATFCLAGTHYEALSSNHLV